MKDRILKDLSQKKLDLLRQMARQTRYLILGSGENPLSAKAQLLEWLEINDRALEAREREVGFLAKEQEKELYIEIKDQLLALHEMTQEAQARAAADQMALEQEKIDLEASTRVSGYVRGQSAYTDNRRIKGQTKRRGWQPSYRYAEAQRP
ncbi:MAG: hypothetical protein RRB13_11175 [bacterium]|nr:hypothetical protein [bacterium]